MAKLMSEAVFRLAYEGEAVADGEMNVADLAPALLGMAQLLKAAGRVIDGEEAEISVRVKSTQNACFEVILSLAVDGATNAWTFLKTPDGQAAATLLQLLGFTAGGFAGGTVGIVRWMKGRRPERVAVGGDTVRLTIDGDEIEVPDKLARLALDPAVRGALEKIVTEPLEKEGIESVTLGDAGSGQTVRKAEGPYFRAMPGGASDEFRSEYRKAFSIVSLSFKPGQKWRLNDGRSNPLVTMSDADFQAKVDAGLESFAKGDILVCDVIERAERTASGFKAEYEIVKVAEHRKVQPPTSMFDAGAESS